MLPYFLATFMAIISLILYLNAFISPKIHRQDDFLWSGLGLFYALILWICSGRITGAVLLGQLAIIAVAIAFIWENRQLRKIITAESESNEVLEGVSLLSLITVFYTKLSELSKKKPSLTNKVKSGKSVEDKPKTEIVKKEETETEKVTDSEKSATPKIVTELIVTDSEKNLTTPIANESVKVVEEIVTKIDDSQKVEKIIEEIVNDVVIDDSLQEEKIIEEIVNEEVKEEENISQSLDKPKIEENTFDDDFDVDSLGLGESSAENKPLSSSKTNIFSKLLGFFRKSSTQKISQPEELVSLPQSSEETILEENIIEIDPKTTATEVENAIANFDLPESNNISEDNQKTEEKSSQNITVSMEKVIQTSVTIVTSETEIMIETDLPLENQEEDSLLTDLPLENQEEDSLLTDLPLENQEEDSLSTDLPLENQEEDSLSTDLPLENQEKKIEFLENIDKDLSAVINSQEIPEEDIIETLADLSIETENSTLDLESPLELENQNFMDELDSIFEDDSKNT
jgi:Ycf66 protein N-terminus